MRPEDALAYACRESGITPPPHEVNTGHVMASILIRRLPDGSALVTTETLAARQHDRWGPGFCVSDLGEHDFTGCDHQRTWLDFAAADIEALRCEPTP